MNKIQTNLLDLFKVLMNYLDENNIPYCAAYGTCLGAVRHKGFIPWDDDIDIYIRREDYNRLLKLITTYNDDNYYFGDLNDSKYPYTFLKFYTKNYKIAEMSLLEKYQTYNNLYIDIFPVDYIDESKLKYGKLYRNLMRVKTSVSPSKMKTLFKRVLSFLIPISVNKIKKNINNLGEKIRTEKSLDICWSESIMPTYLLDDLIDVPFEDIMIKVPKDYDNYLKCMFGDYMTLPPVEERVSNHTFKELN